MSSETSVGMDKTKSAQLACQKLNSEVKIERYSEGLEPSNAISIIEKFDVVVDASDNAPTRYLIRYPNKRLAKKVL